MGMFDFLKTETREAVIDEKALDLTLRNGFESEPITKTQALNIPAVAASVEFISGTLASIPIKLYRKDPKDGNKEEIVDDYRLRLLNEDTGDLLDAVQMKKSVVSDYLLDGSGYIFVNWQGNEIKSLHYVEHSQVAYIKNEDPIFKKADFLVTGRRFEDYEMLRICRDTVDGVTGTGIVDKHSTLLKSMYNSLKYESKALATGTKKGFLKSASKLQEAQVKELKEAYRQLFKDDASDTMILNGGISFEGVSSTAAELQQNENKVTNTSDVYSIFGINDDLFTVSSSSKDAYINSIKTAVFPVISAMEAAFNKFLLTNDEKENGLFFAFDTKSIMKGDILNRYKAYETAAKEGFMTIDEIRREENYPPIGLDKIKLSLGTVFYSPETGEIFNINTNSVMNTEGGVTNES
ncbi:MAG: phage portal protein [Clostridia bacterium]|nr:phage portal protein [Clostridia bacterium]